MTELADDREARRLSVLDSYDILDTPDESAYDDLTRLAAFICGTPIALITLVDRDRQWFKSKIGLARRETPRDMSFCAHAIQDPQQVLIVPDATRDERFADNGLVTGEPGIKFYAGAPMISPEGAPLGTICVIDNQARRLSASQIEALEILARQVVGLLELRRTNAQLAALSLTDPLTGIPNRRALMGRLEEEIARAQRSGEALSLLMIDIDHFKSYNDTFGHPAGDQALREVAQQLAAGARPYDFTARYGGEEFAVILPKTDLEPALIVAERLRGAVATAAVAHRRLTLSIGVARLGADFDATALLRMADRALYKAKAAGRNGVRS
jgi:diguanylate cyclase (GGDEF)-like protein